MVDKRIFLYKLLFISYILCIVINLNASSSVHVNQFDVQFCWNGTVDDLSIWRNLSCSTGASTLGNSLSTKILSSGEDDYRMTRSNSEYYCMAFKYFDSSQSSEGGEDTRMETSKAIYTCDTDKICDGRTMMEGYKYNYKGHDGMLYCCNNGNNCNKHGIIEYPPHKHTCFNGVKDFTKNTTDGKLVITEECTRKNSLCMKIVYTKEQTGNSVKTKEEYKCDSTGLCEQENLTRANNHACKQLLFGDTVEEVCCCKGDRCYVPRWHIEPATRPVQLDQMQAQNTWQRTLLIILGVALGILVIGVTMYFVRKSIVATKRNESPTRNAHLVYKSVNSNNDDGVFYDDSVKILTAYK